jgi:hypothetical protein
MSSIMPARRAGRDVFFTRPGPLRSVSIGTIVKAAARPHASEKMIWWLVSPRIGNVKNNDPRLIAPIAAVG